MTREKAALIIESDKQVGDNAVIGEGLEASDTVVFQRVVARREQKLNDPGKSSASESTELISAVTLALDHFANSHHTVS